MTTEWSILENVRNPYTRGAWMKLARLPNIGETVEHRYHDGEKVISRLMTVTRVEPLGHNGKAGTAIGVVYGDNVRVEYDLSDLYPTEESAK